jgi:UDP-glucose 4-epimerase
MGSRGSVIPLFYQLIDEEQPITITDPNMTRFMMTLDDAVDLVVFEFKHGNQGDLFIQKSPAATIDTLAKAVCKYKGVPINTKIIGLRHGEKDHEVLVTREEMVRATDMGDYYKVSPDERDQNYDKFYQAVTDETKDVDVYSSSNTERLNVDEMIDLLKEMGEIEK